MIEEIAFEFRWKVCIRQRVVNLFFGGSNRGVVMPGIRFRERCKGFYDEFAFLGTVSRVTKSELLTRRRAIYVAVSMFFSLR